jgi:hypothetical protein
MYIHLYEIMYVPIYVCIYVTMYVCMFLGVNGYDGPIQN